jgi:hypothetical protein
MTRADERQVIETTFLKSNAKCFRCGRWANVAYRVQSIRCAPELEHEPSNLRAACASCAAILEGRR